MNSFSGKLASQIPSRLKKVLGLLKMSSFMLLVRMGAVNPLSPRYRLLRARILRRSSESLAKTYKRFGFFSPVFIEVGDQIRVSMDGIPLSVEGTDRYFKTSRRSGANDGASMATLLKKIGIVDPRTIVDLGANFGEVSLYFAKLFPEARIVAVEPSPENLRVFRSNIDFQTFSCDRLELHEIAISSESGLSELFEAGGESSITWRKSARPIMVQTNSLAGFWDDNLLGEVDFVKVDIEGAAPHLLNDLHTIASNASVWLIELDIDSEGSGPAPFFELFEELGFAIADRETEVVFPNTEYALRFVGAGHESTARDFWFIKRELVPNPPQNLKGDIRQF